jgi:hypothetical protein
MASSRSWRCSLVVGWAGTYRFVLSRHMVADATGVVRLINTRYEKETLDQRGIDKGILREIRKRVAGG